MNLDLNLIKTFLQVHQSGSYTTAAEQLNLTQPAISAAIKRLEREINSQLFIKHGRGIKATAQADKLANRFHQALDDIENAIVERETFNLYVSEVLLHVMPLSDSLVYKEPPLNQYEIFQDIRLQKIDLAIGVVTNKDSSLVFEEAYSEPAVVICRKHHPRIQTQLTEQDFYQEKHIVHTLKWDKMSGFEYGALGPTKERQASLTISSVSALAMHVSQSDSLGIVSRAFAKKWQKMLALNIFPCPIPLKDLSYSFVYHRRYINDKAHKTMRDKLKQQLQSINE